MKSFGRLKSITLTLAGHFSVSLWTMLTLTAQGLMEDPLSGLQFAINICILHGCVSSFILMSGPLNTLLSRSCSCRWFMVIRPRTSGPSWTKECFNKSWGLLQIAHSQIPTYFSSNPLAGTTEHYKHQNNRIRAAVLPSTFTLLLQVKGVLMKGTPDGEENPRLGLVLNSGCTGFLLQTWQPWYLRSI